VQAAPEEAGGGDRADTGDALIPSEGSPARPVRQHQALGSTP
jgi:hypothetical protein